MSPNRFLITDTNADGKPDIVHFNGGNKGVSVFIGDGLGNFGTKRKDTYADWTGLTIINPDPTTHRLADINGDGLLDWIAINTTAGGASLYMNKIRDRFIFPLNPDTLSAYQQRRREARYATDRQSYFAVLPTPYSPARPQPAGRVC